MKKKNWYCICKRKKYCQQAQTRKTEQFVFPPLYIPAGKGGEMGHCEDQNVRGVTEEMGETGID